MTDCMHGAFNPPTLTAKTRRMRRAVTHGVYIAGGYAAGALGTLAWTLARGSGLSECDGMETCLPVAASIGIDAAGWPLYWVPQLIALA